MYISRVRISRRRRRLNYYSDESIATRISNLVHRQHSRRPDASSSLQVQLDIREGYAISSR